MPRHPREAPARINPLILLFPVAMGIIGWVVMSRTAPPPASDPKPLTSSVVSSPSSTTRIVLGRSQPSADRDQRFIYDVDAQTFAPTSTEKGWRLPLSSSAHVTRPTDTGAWLLRDADWSVALRNKRGNAYLDPLFVGAFDTSHFAVAAIDSDRRVILSVSRTGDIRELTALNEQTVPLTVQDGRVWVVESAPREGIEVPPHGPSTLWSIAGTGATTTRVVDERKDSLVTDVIANGQDVAFASDQNDIRLVDGGRLLSPLKGKSLGWLLDHRLVFLKDRHLCLVSLSSFPVCGSVTVPDELVWLGSLSQ